MREDIKRRTLSVIYTPALITLSFSLITSTVTAGASLIRSDLMYSSNGYNIGSISVLYGKAGPAFNSYASQVLN